MRNPYDDEQDLTEYRVSRRAALWVTSLFLLGLGLPPVLDFAFKAAEGKIGEVPWVRLFQFNPGGQQTLREHIAEVEGSLDQLPYAATLRRHTQQALTQFAGEGNRKVMVGRNGWLFYRPELEALNGWGPLEREPFSVMKDPVVAKLRPAKEHVLEFAKQLQERGIALLLVPLPTKPMLYPEHLLGQSLSAPLTHPDQDAFYDELRAAGVDVLDLGSALHGFKQQEAGFLKQDTHWTPAAMEKAAEQVTSHLQRHYSEDVKAAAAVTVGRESLSDRESIGDLVGLLDLSDVSTLFATEKVDMTAIHGAESDPDSPITVLGDSFVNIYSDPKLGFGDPALADEESPPSMRAGFAEHLMALLGRRLEVIARNGAGTTQTRREFAAKPDDVVRSKKLVVWVLASRDLIYTPAAARAANIEWSSVNFNPNSSQVNGQGEVKGQVVIEAELLVKSSNQDPNGTPYPDALHTALYRVTQVVEGEFAADTEWQAIQWTFKQKQMQKTAYGVVGKRYRLTLIPWDEQVHLQSLNRSSDQTDEDDFLAERWFVLDAEEL